MADEIDYIHACSACLEVFYAAGKGGVQMNHHSLFGFAADKGDYIHAC
jgi:hypothetical protein